MTNQCRRSLPLLLLLGAALTVGACAAADVVAHSSEQSSSGNDFAAFPSFSNPASNPEIQAP